MHNGPPQPSIACSPEPGIRVVEISFDDLEPYLATGRMPALETVYLSELHDLNKNELELVAWSQQQDDASAATGSC